ncbi:hypothetical protein RFI_15196, partial [Reticulomyxa filosa]
MYEKALVICLDCGKTHCSRQSTEQHGIGHFKGAKHALVLNVPSVNDYMNSPDMQQQFEEYLVVWCYQCDAFWSEVILPKNSSKINAILDVLKPKLTKMFRQYQKDMKSGKLNAKMNNAKSKGKGKGKGKDREDDEESQTDSKKRSRTESSEKTPEMTEQERAALVEKWSALNRDDMVEMTSSVSSGYVGIVGLTNLGNTCFFNSVTQCLVETRPLILQLWSEESQASMIVSKNN